MAYNFKTGQDTDDDDSDAWDTALAAGKTKPDDLFIKRHDRLIEERANGDFTYGNSEESGPAATLVCKVCGGDRWQVGQSSLMTFVKCPTCGHEILIHDG